MNLQFAACPLDAPVSNGCEAEQPRKAAPLKICSRCGEAKSTSQYFNHKGTADGLRPFCKACKRAGEIRLHERKLREAQFDNICLSAPAGLVVRQAKIEIVRPLIEKVHYAHSWPGTATHYFGLFHDEKCVGVAIYGAVTVPALRRSIVKDNAIRILELQRLVVTTPVENAASALIGKSLQLLSKIIGGAIIISYADSGHGHVGIIYQATNWYFAGLSAGGEKTFIVNGRKIHGRTYRYHGGTSGVEIAGSATKKYRYVTVVGPPRERKHLLGQLLWRRNREYPKAAKQTYDAPNQNRKPITKEQRR